jgi:hypothetical protein
MAPARVAVDFHLHFYGEYDEDAFWRALIANLDRGAAALGHSTMPLERVALLTEATGLSMFSRWRERTGSGPGGIRFMPTSEPYSLALHQDGERRLQLIAGRQIVTAERLEVLTAGAAPPVPDNRPLASVVDELVGAGSLAIIPWGAGKWLGRRGRLVRETAGRIEAPVFFLADNPARPSVWPPPRIFHEMERRGRAVLRGSDPLPLAGEEKRAGALASLLEGEFDPLRPLGSLIRILAARGRVRGLGRRDGPVTFLWRQLRLRL